MKILKLLKKQLQNKDYLPLHLKKFSILRKGSGVIIHIHDTTSKILSRNPNYIVDVVMRLNFG